MEVLKEYIKDLNNSGAKIIDNAEEIFKKAEFYR